MSTRALSAGNQSYCRINREVGHDQVWLYIRDGRRVLQCVSVAGSQARGQGFEYIWGCYVLL